ncbi:MAG: hypothetical protein LBU24_05695 [Methanocalculaceae archaeon]|jgi:hypothetical protein|nr:hypothetical protein [Methanocalculaceae archaeon]
MAENEINVLILQGLDQVCRNLIQIAFKDDEYTLMFLPRVPAVNLAKAKAVVSIIPAHAKIACSAAEECKRL